MGTQHIISSDPGHRVAPTPSAEAKPPNHARPHNSVGTQHDAPTNPGR